MGEGSKATGEGGKATSKATSKNPLELKMTLLWRRG
jgi:hypothetical protein